MIDPVQPMEPEMSEVIPEGKEWLAQVKWDGVRVLTYYNGSRIQLYNRKRNERTFHYPELLDIKKYCLASSVILDGEIIALGDDGKPSFHEVMRRDAIRIIERVNQVKSTIPITYMIFDIIYYNSQWIINIPLFERIKILKSIIIPGPNIQLVTSHEDGSKLFSTIQNHGMEGIVMKQKDSCYYPGQKKDVWLKVKNYRDLIAVVAGFTLNGGVINSLLLGLYDNQGNLWYIGHTGTGKLTRPEWRSLTDLLCTLKVEEQPFVNRPKRHKDAFWVDPNMTVKIRYAEWTECRSLRQPIIQAIVNIPPSECKFN